MIAELDAGLRNTISDLHDAVTKRKIRNVFVRHCGSGVLVRNKTCQVFRKPDRSDAHFTNCMFRTCSNVSPGGSQSLTRTKIDEAFNLENACICCNAFISSHFELFLNMISKEDIEKMSVSDRLETIEKIWESISVSGYVQSPDWHKRILKSREDKVASGNANFLDLNEVRERLKRKSDEKSRHS